jgi:hypothetical protein
MRRRVFFIFIAGIVTFIAALVFLLTRQPGTNDQNNTLPRADAPGLTITNAGQYSDRLDLAVFTDIQKLAYERVKFYGDPGKYQGVVRENSFKVTYHDYDATTPPTKVPRVEFILDIPEAKQSYDVSFAGGDGYPYSILYVLCPDASQLKYGDFGCTDEN